MDINTIVGIVLIAIIGIFAIVGFSKGGTRTIIGILCSSVVVLLASAAVSAILPALLADMEVIDLVGEVNGILNGIEVDFVAELSGTLNDVLFSFNLGDLAIEFSILYIAIVAVCMLVVYLVMSFVFYLLKCIFVGIFRGIRPKLVDYLFGVIIWAAIGAGIAFGIIFGVEMLYNAELGIEALDEILSDLVKGEGLFSTLRGLLVDFGLIG